MESYKKGDQVEITKSIDPFIQKGTIFEIVDITPKFTTLYSGVIVGFAQNDEMGTLFRHSRQWTKWEHSDMFGFEYRTDNKKYVQMKINGVMVQASCHPDDMFDLNTGLIVCLNKAYNNIQTGE